MATVVIISEEMVQIVHHEGGPISTYSGKVPTEKEAVKDIKEIIQKMNRVAAINQVVEKASYMGKTRKKLGLKKG